MMNYSTEDWFDLINGMNYYIFDTKDLERRTTDGETHLHIHYGTFTNGDLISHDKTSFLYFKIKSNAVKYIFKRVTEMGIDFGVLSGVYMLHMHNGFMKKMSHDLIRAVLATPDNWEGLKVPGYEDEEEVEPKPMIAPYRLIDEDQIRDIIKQAYEYGHRECTGMYSEDYSLKTITEDIIKNL